VHSRAERPDWFRAFLTDRATRKPSPHSAARGQIDRPTEPAAQHSVAVTEMDRMHSSSSSPPSLSALCEDPQESASSGPNHVGAPSVRLAVRYESRLYCIAMPVHPRQEVSNVTSLRHSDRSRSSRLNICDFYLFAGAPGTTATTDKERTT
jgi:hypothetical protein